VLATGGPDADIEQIRKNVDDLGIPLVVGPKAAVNAVTALLEDQRRQEHLAGRAEIPELALDGGFVWRARDEAGAKALLDSLGFSTPRRRVCDSKASALAAFAELEKPLVAKILGVGIQHKTELGGVHLRLGDQSAFEDAIDQLSTIGASSFLIEEMAADGVDLILSARRDPTFGVSVMIGLGGTAAEAVDDVAIRIAPMSRADAVEITDELAAHEVLHGWRGGPVLDRSELAALLLNLAAVLIRYPALSMLEVNPLRVCAHGLVALDAVIEWSLSPNPVAGCQQGDRSGHASEEGEPVHEW
jgi:acetate---CoA ligase (ADP-forming)